MQHLFAPGSMSNNWTFDQVLHLHVLFCSLHVHIGIQCIHLLSMILAETSAPTPN